MLGVLFTDGSPETKVFFRHIIGGFSRLSGNFFLYRGIWSAFGESLELESGKNPQDGQVPVSQRPKKTLLLPYTAAAEEHLTSLQSTSVLA